MQRPTAPHSQPLVVTPFTNHTDPHATHLRASETKPYPLPDSTTVGVHILMLTVQEREGESGVASGQQKPREQQNVCCLNEIETRLFPLKMFEILEKNNFECHRQLPISELPAVGRYSSVATG